MQNKIELHKERDFSSVLGDSVAFVKQNFKQMGKSLILIVLPPFVLASVMFGVYFMQVLSTTAQFGMGNRTSPLEIFSSIFSPTFWLTMLFYFVTILLAVTVIFIYIKIYSQRTDDSPISTQEVWNGSRAVLLRFFFFSIGYFFVFLVAYFILAFFLGLIMFGLMKIPVLGVVISALMGLFLLIAVITYVSVLLPVTLYENTGFFETFGRTSSLLKGSFWQTAAIIFVAYILVFVFGLGFSYLFEYIKSLVLTGTDSYRSGTLNTMVIIYFAITPVIMLIAYAFQLSVSSFNYFSLLEKRDHVGLKMKVDTMGDANTGLPEEQY